MRKCLLAIMILLFAAPAWATDYFLRADGTAASKAAATGPCGTQANTMSLSDHNGYTFAAGDTVYVCDDGGVYSGTALTVPSSGASGSVITYVAASGDNPEFWGSTKYIDSLAWDGGPDGNGVYTETYAMNPATNPPVINDSWDIVAQASDYTDCAGTEDSWFWDDPTNTFYYNPDGAIDSVGIRPNNAVVDLNEKSYITIDGLILVHQATSAGDGIVRIYKDSEDSTAATNVTIQNCTFRLGRTGIHTEGASHNLTVSGNTFADCGVALYALNDEGQVNTVTITENTIYHTSQIDGSSYDNAVGDSGAISLQGGNSWTITYNHIYDWQGMGINPWLGASDTMHTLTIKYNWIDIDSSDTDDEYCAGISFSGAASDESDRWNNGLIMYNVFKDCVEGSDAAFGGAIRTRHPIPTTASNKLKIYGNTMFNCYAALNAQTSGSTSEHGWEFKNNISDTPQTAKYHVLVENATDPSGIDIDNNVFYPDTAGANNLFDWMDDPNAADYADFKADASADGVTIDSGGTGRVTDPKLTSDYRLEDSSSSALNNGLDLGADYDDALRGNSKWPDKVNTLEQGRSGSGWEIGAFIYDERGSVGVSR